MQIIFKRVLLLSHTHSATKQRCSLYCGGIEWDVYGAADKLKRKHSHTLIEEQTENYFV